METYSIKLLVPGSRGIWYELYIGNLKFIMEHSIGESLLKKAKKEQVKLEDVVEGCKESKEIEFIGGVSEEFMKSAQPMIVIEGLTRYEIQEVLISVFGDIPDKAYIYTHMIGKHVN